MDQHMKKCTRCNKTQPITEFYQNPNMASGRVNHCKACYKKARRNNYKVMSVAIPLDLVKDIQRVSRKQGFKPSNWVCEVTRHAIASKWKMTKAVQVEFPTDLPTDDGHPE